MTRGFTLVEMMLVLAITAALAGLSLVAWPAVTETPLSRVRRELRETRARAIASGRAAIWRGQPGSVRFAADGSAEGGPLIVGGDTVRVNPLTGAVDAAR